MSGEQPPATGSLPLSLERRVDEACDRFEAAWRACQRPRIEDHLAAAPAADRVALLRGLLALEIDLRREAGDRATPEEYKRQFPDEGRLVDAVFAEAADQLGSGEGATTPHTPPTDSSAGDPGPAPPAGSPPAGEYIGRYKVVRRLGGGTFGEVYLAHDGVMDRQVAIKVPSAWLLATERARGEFLREARSVARLQHEGIVRAYDFGQEADGRCYIVYEFVEGMSLAERIQPGRLATAPLPPEEAARIVAQAAEALHHAHLQGMFHRDVKPANILLDRQGRPKVADFGLAVREEDLAGQRGVLAGTLPYMSPEQVRRESHHIDGRTDIYSLGVLLYELLCGRRPFEAKEGDELEDRILHREARPPRQIKDSIPAELERICLKAIAKRVADRYPTAADLAAELRAWLAGSPVGRGPPHVKPGKQYGRRVGQFRTAPQALGGAPAPRGAPADDLSPHYFASQRRIIDEEARRFVGREHAVAALDRFTAAHPRGYFLVRGGPGQGKTAFACHLTATRNLIHHLAGTAGAGSTDPRLILRSLLAQLLPLAGGPGTLPEGIPELSKCLCDALTRIAAGRKGLTVVIDGLDELPGPADSLPPFLPAAELPDGVYFVVTSRPGDRLDALAAALYAVDFETYELGALGVAEIAAILRGRRPNLSAAQVERVAEACQGNPLYLLTAADELARNPHFDLRDLPPRVEGFFRRATDRLRGDANSLGRQVLGLLSVARKPLSLRELSQAASAPQLQVYEQGLKPVRQFLIETDDGYSFYHARFRDFVAREFLFEDELPQYHRRLAAWLGRPQSRGYDYRWASLAHHLFEAGDHTELLRTIGADFLRQKVRRFGYAVLEDVELLTRALMAADDPGLVGRCAALVEELRAEAGGDILTDIRQAVQGYRPGPASFRSRVLAPPVAAVPGLDVWVGMLPKVEVGADFFEVVPRGSRLVLVLGDAPGAGLKPAFVARFVGNLCRRLVERDGPRDLGELLGQLDEVVSSHDYFEMLAVQCAEIDPLAGLLTIANAGVPFPVLYSARWGTCDRLSVRGVPLHAGADPEAPPVPRTPVRAEVGPGDVFVMVTDGVTEGNCLNRAAYGYRFQRLVGEAAARGARAVGEAILDDWRAYPREGDYTDDVTVLVAVVTPTPPR